jgi:hypothetical protein
VSAKEIIEVERRRKAYDRMMGRSWRVVFGIRVVVGVREARVRKFRDAGRDRMACRRNERVIMLIMMSCKL